MGETEFNGQHYNIYNFVDPKSLQIIRGTNLEVQLKEFESYDCDIRINRGKLKVTKVYL